MAEAAEAAAALAAALVDFGVEAVVVVMALAATLVAVAALQRCWQRWGRYAASGWTGRTVESWEAMPTVKGGARGSRSNSKQRGGGRGAASRSSAVSSDAHSNGSCTRSDKTADYASAVNVISVQSSGKSEESFTCASNTNTSNVLIPLVAEVIGSTTPDISTCEEQCMNGAKIDPSNNYVTLSVRTEEQDTIQYLYNSSVLPYVDHSVYETVLSSANELNVSAVKSWCEHIKDTTTLNSLTESEEVKKTADASPVKSLTEIELRQPSASSTCSTSINSSLQSEAVKQSFETFPNKSVAKIVFEELSVTPDSVTLTKLESVLVSPPDLSTFKGTTNDPLTTFEDSEVILHPKDVLSFTSSEEPPITWVATVTMSRSVSRDFARNESGNNNYETESSSDSISTIIPVDDVKKIEFSSSEYYSQDSSNSSTREPGHNSVSNEQNLTSKANMSIVTPYNPISNTTPYTISVDSHLNIEMKKKRVNDLNCNKKKKNAHDSGKLSISSSSAPETSENNIPKSKVNNQKPKKVNQFPSNMSSPTSVNVTEEKITSYGKKRPKNKRGKDNKPKNSEKKKASDNRPDESNEIEVPTGFPTPDDKVLDGVEEGLDPKGPLRLQKCERFGRYLAAARALQTGERVLLEPAALVGPRADASTPTCIRCLRSLPRPPPLCDLCCATPLCGRCLHKDAPFGEAECMWLRARRGPPPDLCRPRVVLCVRALLMRRLKDERWERVERLEAHEEARRNGEAWEETRIHVVEPLQAAELLEPDEDETLLQRISGILDVNTFEVRASGGPGTEVAVAAGPARALFPAAALLAHDCLPSAHVAVDEKHVVHVRTARPLKEGEPLTLCYAAPLQATPERREHLLEGKYFRCECVRCRDPEEGGSRLGGVRCPRCRTGDLLPPRCGSGWWSCVGDGGTGCGHRAPPELARTTHAHARDLVEEAAAAEDERRMEALLLTLRRSLPAMAAPCIALLQALMASYRSRLQSEPRPATALLVRQTSLARELLSVAGTLAPGDPRLAAIARYELHGALAALAQRRHAPTHGASPAGGAAAALAEGLREAERELTAAAAALLLEPPASPEGRLGRVAVAQLRELREDILQAESMAAEEAKLRADAERRWQHRRGGELGGGGQRAPSGGSGGTPSKEAATHSTIPPATDPEGGKKKRRRGGKHRKQANDQHSGKQN